MWHPNLRSNILIVELQHRKFRENEIDKEQKMPFPLFVITRHHGLGFTQHIPDCFPSSLPELPMQLRDLRKQNINY